METDISRIWSHLEWLASEPRYAETERLEECRKYCEDALTSSKWGVERRQFQATGSMLQSLTGINLVAKRSNAVALNRPVFVLGAHVDSCKDTPGADDNASAVAVLLETARVLDQVLTESQWANAAVELELVVFDLEEHGMLGGAFHAASCRESKRNLQGMVSLEMLGYCCHESGSQTLPDALEGLYPDVGDFIAVVGNQNSTELIAHFENSMRRVPDLPVQALQIPDNGHPLPPTRLSDHSPFWDEGFPALMITDTSYLRNPHYHETTDTPETLDQEFLRKVADGVLQAMQRMVLGPE